MRNFGSITNLKLKIRICWILVLSCVFVTTIELNKLVWFNWVIWAQSQQSPSSSPYRVFENSMNKGDHLHFGAFSQGANTQTSIDPLIRFYKIQKLDNLENFYLHRIFKDQNTSTNWVSLLQRSLQIEDWSPLFENKLTNPQIKFNRSTSQKSI